MKNYIIISVTMLFLVDSTKTSVVQKDVGSQAVKSKEELHESISKVENNVPLSPCGSCGSCGSCSTCPCPCPPQSDTTSSCIAIKAAQSARTAAAAQQMAAAQASQIVRAQLAEKAMQAAEAATAALACKLILVHQLVQEVCTAEAVLTEEWNSCQRTQYNFEISLAAAGFASQLLKELLSALQTSQSNLGYSQAAMQGTYEELAEKLALLEAAKCRLNALIGELCVARQDLAAISQAAARAQAAARCAGCCAQHCKRSNQPQTPAVMNIAPPNVLQNGKVRELPTGGLRR